METIKNYLDNIFKSLPQTAEITRLRSEILLDMEAKYNELRQHGSSENEAIGKVIAEFGNVDELISELGITKNSVHDDAEPFPPLHYDHARDYITQYVKSHNLVAIGVSLILFGVSAMMAIYGLVDIFDFIPFLSSDIVSILPVALLLLLIAPAVMLFIYSETFTKKYNFIDSSQFTLDSYTYHILKDEAEALNKGKSICTAIGVSLIIIGVVFLLILSTIGDGLALLGTCVLLLFVMVSVFIFITSNSRSEAYDKLLKQGEYAHINKKNNKVIGAVASVVWPIATCIFLVWGFMFKGWGISWIVYPITGILFGAFSGFYSIVSGNKEK